MYSEIQLFIFYFFDIYKNLASFPGLPPRTFHTPSDGKLCGASERG